MRAVCGLDVHKDSVFLCILCETGEIIEKVFGVLTHQLREMRRMMQSHGVSEVTMESTAVYWIPVWRGSSSIPISSSNCLAARAM